MSIRVTNIRKCHKESYDKIYLIVRSVASLQKANSQVLQYAEHCPDLSPSLNLFYRYREWVKTGEWNEQKFETEYAPTFKAEIASNAAAEKTLNELAELSKTQNIALLCFCTDENLCHRKIIGEMLQERGAQVIFDKK